jgi:replicative DNA helicase
VNEPICAIEAERLLIGSIFRNGSLLFHARETLVPGDFWDGNLRRIFAILGELADAGRDVDFANFQQWYADKRQDDTPLLSEALGAMDLAMYKPSAAAYVGEIRQKAQLRAISMLADSVAERAYERDANPEELVSELDQKLLDIVASGPGHLATLEQQTYDGLADIDAQRRGDSSPCHPTGITQLDSFIGGLGKGELTVLGGRPGMGKSSAVAQAIIANCSAGTFVHVFSVEMTSKQLLRRIWAAVSGVAFHRVRHPERMNDAEANDVRKAAMRVSTWPLLIDDTANLSVDQLVARVRGSKRRHQTGVVAIDYLQKLRFSKKLEHRYLDVTNAAVSLAQLAKEEQVAILLLSSLTERSGKNRNDPPTLSDFRQSGDIAFEAHNALLIHRTVDEESQQISSDTAIIVAKARADRTGNVQAMFNVNTLLFEEVGHHVM